jgi:hypothetical protein
MDERMAGMSYVYTILYAGKTVKTFTELPKVAAWLSTDEGYLVTCVLRTEEGEPLDPMTAMMLSRRDVFGEAES